MQQQTPIAGSEDPTRVEVSIAQDPIMLGPTPKITTSGDIAAEATADVEQQRKVLTEDEFLATASDDDYVKYMGLKDRADAGDDDAFVRSQAMLEPVVSLDGVAKPFVRDGEVVVPETITDPYKVDAAKALADQKMKLDGFLIDKVPDARVRQILVDQIDLGDFGQVFLERTAEAGRGIVTLGTIPFGASPLNTAAKYAAFATSDWLSGKAADWSTAYAAYSADIQAESQQKLDNIAKVLPGPTLGMAVQDFIEDKLQTQLDDGKITQEEYNEILFDQDGNKRRFMSDEDAQATLSYSFDELPLAGKFGVIALENTIGMAGFGAGRAAAGAATLKRVNQLKDEFADLVVRGERVGDITDAKRVVEALEIAGKLTTNKVSRKLTRINMKNLEIGLREDRLNRTIAAAARENQEMGFKLDAMRRAGVSAKDPDFISLKNQYELGQNRMLRATFRGRTMPLVAENVTNALTISAIQLGAREHLPGWTGMDADTSEMIGALIGGFGGYKPVKGIIGSAGRRLDSTLSVGGVRVSTGFGRMMDFVAYVGTMGTAKSLFTDDTLRKFQAETGVKLSATDLQGIRYGTRLIQNMDDDQMDLVVKAAQDYMDLQERIVGAFPPAMQGEAADLFRLSFAEASMLGPLAGLNRLATGRVDIRNLKSLNGKGLFELQKQQELQVARAEAALDNLQAMVDSTPDMAGRQQVLDFIGGTKSALRQNEQSLTILAEDTLATLDELEQVLFDDLTIDMPDGIIENLILARESSMKRLGKAFDRKAEILRLQEVFEDGMAQRLDVVAGFRGRPEYEDILRAETENFIDIHMGVFRARGRTAYENVVAFSEGREPIDISSLITKALDDADQPDMIRFFAPEGEFFNGKMGNQAFEVAEAMAKRVFSEEQINDMRNLLKTSMGDTADNLSDLEIALRVDAASGMKVFAQANPYEVDVMRRAFRDYALQMADKNPQLARISRQFEKDIDQLIATQDKEMYDMLVEARKTYRSEVGDRMRSGSTLQKLDKSRQGAAMDVPQGGLKYRYSNVDPVSVFNPISTNIGKVIAGGQTGKRAANALRRQLNDLMIDFGDRTPQGNVFDLSTTHGQANFRALSTLLRERVYTDWAAGVTKNLQRPTGDIRTRSLKERLGGYDFERSADWDEVQDMLMVDVIDETGKRTKRPLVDLDAIVENENSIEKLIKDNAEVKVKYDAFAAEAKTATSQVRLNASNNAKFEATAFEELKNVLDNDPERFYINMVERGTVENFEAIRDMSISALTKGGRSTDEAEEMFDLATKSLISRALLGKSQVSAVKGPSLTATAKGQKFSRNIPAPEQMLESIDSNREILEHVLGEEHVGYLEDIADFMNRADQSQFYNFEGVVRGYGTNEALSRVYNMARGMVSPLYVTSEFAVRLASQANVEILQLVGQDMNSARIITNMFKYPELVTRKDMDYLNDSIKEFVLTEITKTGADPSIYLTETENDEQ